jgi:hypothetical protein
MQRFKSSKISRVKEILIPKIRDQNIDGFQNLQTNFPSFMKMEAEVPIVILNFG